MLALAGFGGYRIGLVQRNARNTIGSRKQIDFASQGLFQLRSTPGAKTGKTC